MQASIKSVPYISAPGSSSERLISPTIMNLDPKYRAYELIASIGTINFLAHHFLDLRLNFKKSIQETKKAVSELKSGGTWDL